MQAAHMALLWSNQCVCNARFRDRWLPARASVLWEFWRSPVLGCRYCVEHCRTYGVSLRSVHGDDHNTLLSVYGRASTFICTSPDVRLVLPQPTTGWVVSWHSAACCNVMCLLCGSCHEPRELFIVSRASRDTCLQSAVRLLSAVKPAGWGRMILMGRFG